MTVEDVLKLIGDYGFNNVVAILLIVNFIKSSERLHKIIDHNTIMLGKVEATIRNCNKK